MLLQPVYHHLPFLILDKKKMHCEPIKNLGFHDVAIKVHPQVTATLRVKVEEK